MQNPQGHQAEIQELLRTSRHAEAEQRLREICARPEADAQSWFYLGVLSGMRGDAAGAENCFCQALARKPDFTHARFNLGIALRDQGRLDEARVELEAVVTAQPGHAEALNALGYVYVRLERPEDAERSFRAALARNPLFPDALINLGNLLSTGKRWAEAIALYRSALQAAPARGDAAINLGSTLVIQGRIEEAISAYQLAIAADPALIDAHVQLGNAYKRLGMMQEAEQALREALRRQPGHAEAQYFLAILGGDAPSAAPVGYVTRLFDQHADTFDTELVGRLQYRVPQSIFEAVQATHVGQGNLDVLDLGCGTGLCGPQFKPLARTLAGVDLSPKMVAQARAKAVYDELEVGELIAALRKRESSLDLAIAADVFIFVGDLVAVFEAAAQALRPGGVFAFSVETASPEEGGGYKLRSSGHYAHARAYVAELATRHGFDSVSCEELCIRLDGSQPVAGALYVLRRRM